MYELIVVGGGPAGLAAAYAAWESGLQRILIVDRDQALGGILNQCIHSGFGLHRFGSELTGPEYAGRYIRMLQHTGVEVALETMVLEVTADRQIHMVSRKDGYRVLEAASVILAMGCRERTRGAIAIPGTRPAGVLTAGTAQRFVNLDGYLPGRRVVILGSGDIGLIMARRMTLEGAKVLCCVEIMPYSSGLNRNIVQCLRDYEIPLYLSHTITEIRGRNRVEQVVLAKVDERRKPIPGTERVLDCDTLLLSVGLIPENELTRKAGIEMDRRTGGAMVYENMETSLPGIFACVHDLVDFVSAESERAGKAAASYVLHKAKPQRQALELIAGEGISYTVPQKIHPDEVGQTIEVFFRVTRPCHSSRIRITSDGVPLFAFRREYLSPGEMEHIWLPHELLEKAAGSLKLSVEEVTG